MSVVPVTRVSKMRDMWFVIIPKAVKQKLEAMGVEHGNLVMWKEIKEKDNVVRVTLEIVRSTSSSKYIRATA